MPKQPMVSRTLRVPLDLWEAAKSKADAEDREVSEVVRELLTKWVTRPPRNQR